VIFTQLKVNCKNERKLLVIRILERNRKYIDARLDMSFSVIFTVEITVLLDKEKSLTMCELVSL